VTGERSAGISVVGRDREITEIERLLAEAVLGRPQILALGGEGGIGKTTLAALAASMAEDEGFDVVWCRLHEHQPTRPYEMWLEMIEEGLGKHLDARGDAQATWSPLELEEIFGRHWNVIAALLPNLLGLEESRNSEPSDPTPSPRRQEDIFDGFVSFIRYLANERRTFIAVDNLHLSDEETLAALEIAGSEIETGSVMIVLTYRTTVPTALDGVLADTLGALSHNGNVVRMRLKRLGRSEVRRMIESLAIAHDEEVVDYIYEQSEGNPLLVEELVELLRVNDGVLDHRSFSDSALNLRVRKTIAARAATLTARERNTLVLAAAAGREFTTSQITSFAPSMSSEEVDACMHAAVQLGIVVETAGTGARYRFTHSIIRDAVFDLAKPAELKQMRTLVGRKLEEYYGSNAAAHAIELYPHFLAGDDPKELQKGIQYALAAGDLALEQFAWKRALSIFGDLLSQYGKAMNPQDSAAAAVGMGSAYCRSVNRVKAAESFRPAFEYYLSVKDFDRLAEIALQPIDIDLGDSYHFPLIEQAAKLVPPDHPRHMELLCAHAYGLFEARGQYDEAEAKIHDLLNTARANGDRSAESRLMLDTVYLHIRFSRYDEAIRIATEALARATIEPDLFVESHAYFLLMQAHLLKGEIDTAKQYSYKSRDSILPYRDSLLTCTGIAHVLRFELRSGNWSEIDRETDRGLEIDPNSLFLLPLRTIAEYYRGHFAAGDVSLERLMKVADGYPAPGALIFASVVVLMAHRWEITRNAKYLNKVRSLVERVLSIGPVPGVEVRARIAQAILACQEADEDEAEVAYERLSTMRTYNLIREYRIERTLGLVRHFTRDYERAAGHFLEAIASCKKYRDLPVLAWTYGDYGDLLSDPNSFGSHADAQDAYAKALTLAIRLEMGPLVERIELAIRRLAESGPHEVGSLLGKRLSPRELEILALVGEGQTDAEIAGILGLSTYTVSNHVRHILQKTGAFNRLEAVRYAERTGLM